LEAGAPCLIDFGKVYYFVIPSEARNLSSN
jgi:hypothetical protein